MEAQLNWEDVRPGQAQRSYNYVTVSCKPTRDKSHHVVHIGITAEAIEKLSWSETKTVRCQTAMDNKRRLLRIMPASAHDIEQELGIALVRAVHNSARIKLDNQPWIPAIEIDKKSVAHRHEELANGVLIIELPNAYSYADQKAPASDLQTTPPPKANGKGSLGSELIKRPLETPQLTVERILSGARLLSASPEVDTDLHLTANGKRVKLPPSWALVINKLLNKQEAKGLYTSSEFLVDILQGSGIKNWQENSVKSWLGKMNMAYLQTVGLKAHLTDDYIWLTAEGK